GKESHEHRVRPIGEAEAHGASCECQKQALRKQLADQPPSSRADGSRTAISFCRVEALASSRLATFAHAISRTRPTTLIRMRNGNENCFRSWLSPWLPEASSRLFCESSRCCSTVIRRPA